MKWRDITVVAKGAQGYMDPMPAGEWEAKRNGSVAPPACLQPMYPGATNEDCLFFNVFTPRLNKSDLPVIVWFLPGAFVIGNMDIYRPEFLLRKDVVLGLFKPDMVSWVGMDSSRLWTLTVLDPDKVTVFGQNARAASVHHQILSPMSKGRIKGCI
ncbi:carboxylesterase 5A-like [Penaeus vannamei]|uniref:carboxylesterase 5A-like n=1 Tax=Penaeus vannamei TaxID=6689 RepID=UPI00387FAC10